MTAMPAPWISAILHPDAYTPRLTAVIITRAQMIFAIPIPHLADASGELLPAMTIMPALVMPAITVTVFTPKSFAAMMTPAQRMPAI